MDVAASNKAAVLAVTICEEDRVALERIFVTAGWRFHHASDCASAMKLIEEFDIPVVICDTQFSGCCWRDLYARAGTSFVGPGIIVASRAADDSLWAEVLNIGAFDVLAKPFEEQEVLWAARTAWEEWRVRGQAHHRARAQSA